MLYLRAFHDDQELDFVRVEEKNVSIGRSPHCDLVLPDLSVSRKHAVVETHGNFPVIRDNASTNGTYVNDRVVQAEVLRPGDVIRIGKFMLKLEARSQLRSDTSKIRVKSLPESLLKSSTQAIDVSPSAREAIAAAANAGSEPWKDRLVRLCDFQKELGFVDSLPSLLDRSLQRILGDLGADRGCVLLGDFQSGDEITSVGDLQPASIAQRGGDESPASELIVPEQLVQFIIDSNCATLLRSLTDSDDVGPESLAAPLLAQDRLLGLVYLERADSRPRFSVNDVQFVSLMASLVAVNVTNTLLFDEIFSEKEKLQAVITGLSEGALVTDREFRVIEASGLAARMLQETENLVGKGLAELFAKVGAVIDLNAIRETLAHGDVRFEVNASGEQDVELAVRITAFRGSVSTSEGAIVFLCEKNAAAPAIALDVAPEEEAMPAPVVEEKAVPDASGDEPGFLKEIATKMREPVSLIEGQLPLLRGELQQSSSARGILTELERGSKALCKIVDQFAGYVNIEVETRAHTEVTGASVEEVDLHTITWDAINRASTVAGQKNVLLNNKLPGDLPSIVGQPTRLAEAVVRVVENAVKSSPEGGIVNIESETRSDLLVIRFIDEGAGVSPEDQQKIFEVSGTEQPGLDLAIARRIVREHGGDVELTSPFRSTNQGCCVSISLPLSPRNPLSSRNDGSLQTAWTSPSTA